MKRFLVPLFLLLFTFSVYCEEASIGPKGPCSYVVDYGLQNHQIYLYGKVRVVTSNKEAADLRVYLCKPNEGADLIVKWVASGPYYCGYWQRVDRGESFTIRFVNDYWNCDIRIKYGDPDKFYSCHGCPPGPF